MASGHTAADCAEKAPKPQAAIICFTQAGSLTAAAIADCLSPEWRCSITLGFGEGKVRLSEWTERFFSSSDALVFVGATGIAVRAIAPYVASKASDPAVVVADERGQWAIPLLSGHLGGANSLAGTIAQGISATAVITTATDINGLWAVDTWAKSQGLLVREVPRIKLVSGRILRGEPVAVYSDCPIAGTPPRLVSVAPDPEAACVHVSPKLDAGAQAQERLHLVPRRLVAGIGCRKGTPFCEIQETFGIAMREAGMDPLALCAVHSIDVKAEEPGLLEFCSRMGLHLQTHTAQELAAVPGSFTPSEFVRKTVGVDNVCERSAMLGALRIASKETRPDRDGRARIVCGKTARNGVTVALAWAEPEIEW